MTDSLRATVSHIFYGKSFDTQVTLGDRWLWNYLRAVHGFFWVQLVPLFDLYTECIFRESQLVLTCVRDLYVSVRVGSWGDVGGNE